MLASFDIGIRHLALCVLDGDAGVEAPAPRIARWEVIDLRTDNTHQACENVVAALDARSQVFAAVTRVVLESQPSVNPKMKQVATAIQVYFVCRYPTQIRLQYVSPRNKLSDLSQAYLSQADLSQADLSLGTAAAAGAVINIDVPSGKGEGGSSEAAPQRRTYAQNKRLAIAICRQLLEAGGEAEWLALFGSHAKKDDLADAFLQGRHALLPPRPRPQAARKRRLGENRAL